MTARYIIGDVLDVLASLPENSVDVAVTSPPFLNLRSYLPDDHPDKLKEIGRELTPAAYLDSILTVTEAVGRVLAPHGSLVWELGDTYSNSGGDKPDGTSLQRTRPAAGGSARSRAAAKRARAARDGTADGHAEAERLGFGGFLNHEKGGGDGWPLPKSLCGVPTLYTWSLAYGFNLLNPQHRVDPWRVRNLMVWCKRSAPVADLRDKFRPSTSYLTIATKAGDRYYDSWSALSFDDPEVAEQSSMLELPGDLVADGWRIGAPQRDYIELGNKQYRGAHFATWPETLCVIPVTTMCPLRVCTTCGEPSRRIVLAMRLAKDGRVIDKDYKADRSYEMDLVMGNRSSPDDYLHTVRKDGGWTDCGHDTWRPGVVLDPFAGSGTTLSVATGNSRDAIGIDIDSRNADLAMERVGPMLLSVEQFTALPQLGGGLEFTDESLDQRDEEQEEIW